MIANRGFTQIFTQTLLQCPKHHSFGETQTDSKTYLGQMAASFLHLEDTEQCLVLSKAFSLATWHWMTIMRLSPSTA